MVSILPKKSLIPFLLLRKKALPLVSQLILLAPMALRLIMIIMFPIQMMIKSKPKSRKPKRSAMSSLYPPIGVMKIPSNQTVCKNTMQNYLRIVVLMWSQEPIPTPFNRSNGSKVVRAIKCFVSILQVVFQVVCFQPIM